MKRPHLIILSLLIIFISCKKEDEPTEKQTDSFSKETLTNNRWFVTYDYLKNTEFTEIWEYTETTYNRSYEGVEGFSDELGYTFTEGTTQIKKHGYRGRELRIDTVTVSNDYVCSKQNIMNFNIDGSYFITDCSGDKTKRKGTWEIENSSTIVLNFGTVVTYTIELLEGNELILTGKNNEFPQKTILSPY